VVGVAASDKHSASRLLDTFVESSNI